jgi:glycosyl hydrolase family 12
VYWPITSVPTGNVSCNYGPDTWSGDASGVGYSVKETQATNGKLASFGVVLNANKGTTEVVGYPSDQCLIYKALPSTLTSSFAVTPPASSSGLDYEYAYDIWLTTASAATSNNWNNDLELMIWNYVNGQVPAGSVAGRLSGGSKVWVAGNNSTGTVSVVLRKNETSGTVDIASIISQLKARGYITTADNGILDVEYGIEAPYGGGQTFKVNAFSVTAK